jgi:flavin reductase (DIM6/NTAB) family NADH-FMN oxidoreductase RutF
MIGAAEFRRVLGHFASGVTIVTTCSPDGRPTGLTASAFTSVSLDPPLVLICVDHKSQTHAPLCEHGRFAVNFLSVEQEALSRKFATTRLDKFDGVPHRMTALGVPVIEGVLAHLQCVTVSRYDEGDHTILVGRVEETDAGEGGEPLLYYRGQYARIHQGTPR